MAEMGGRVLYVGVDAGEGVVLQQSFDRQFDGFEVVTAPTVEDWLDRHDDTIHCVVSDFEHSLTNGPTLLKDAGVSAPELPVILFEGTGADPFETPERKDSGQDSSDETPSSETNTVRRERYDRLARRVAAATGHRTESDPGPESAERLPEHGDFNDKIRELQRFTARLQAADGPDAIIELTMTAIQDVLRFDWAGISIAVDGWLELRATTTDYPLDSGVRNLRVDEGVIGAVYQSGEPRLTNDIQHDDTADPATDAFRSGIAVPLGDRGVFMATAATVGFFDQTDIELAEVLMSHVAQALERAEHEQRVHDLNDRIERLHQVATDLQTCQTTADVYELAIDAAESILAFDSSVIAVQEDGAFELVAVSADSPHTVGEQNRPVDDGIVGDSFESGESRLITDTDQASTTGHTRGRFRSGITVPIGERGVFRASSDQPGYYDEVDLELAELLVANVREALARVDREQVIRERERELTRQNERLERFAGVVSHDLRNPLAVAKGYVDFLDETDAVEHIRRSLDRMEAIIADVLELARQGESIDEPAPVDLAAVAKRAWQSVDTGDASLTVDTDDASLLSDESRFAELMENLFRNAIQHGDPDVAVRVATTESGFVVDDDGPGIPSENRDQVLDMGFTSAEEGTGFGLAIVAEIAHAHGWRIDVDSSESGGARFVFTDVEWVDPPA